MELFVLCERCWAYNIIFNIFEFGSFLRQRGNSIVFYFIVTTGKRSLSVKLNTGMGSSEQENLHINLHDTSGKLSII
jgi:hypothetical protein